MCINHMINNLIIIMLYVAFKMSLPLTREQRYIPRNCNIIIWINTRNCSNNPTHNANLMAWSNSSSIQRIIILLLCKAVKLFQVEEHLMASRNEVVNLNKDILHLSEQLQKKDNEILELKKEIDILKEELTLRFC